MSATDTCRRETLGEPIVEDRLDAYESAPRRWVALRDGYDGAPDAGAASRSGTGPTRHDAIADLLDQENPENVPLGADEVRELLEGGS